MPAHSIVIATPDSAQRSRLVRIVGHHPDFKVVACTGDLMNTYNEVEAQLPRAVLIADCLAELPEFEVMHALFSTLDIRWLVVKASISTLRPGPPKYILSRSSADLFTIAADAPEEDILRQLLSLTRTVASRVPAASKTFAPNIFSSRPPAMRSEAKEDAVLTPAIGHTTSQDQVILIGSSTGGVDALLSILSHFPSDCPPTLIVQHTGAGFGESLVGLLDRQCRARVELASETSVLRTGVVTIGAGTRRHLVMRDCRDRTCGLDHDKPVSGHVPSVDMLFHSAIPMAGKVVAALLTGMGRDGAEGLKALRDAGAFTIAQDEQSSVVYGMPRAAAEMDAAQKVLPLDRIGPVLLQTATSKLPRSREMLR